MRAGTRPDGDALACNMTAEDLRRIALGMTDAIEGAHMGHPDFRVNGRIFATLHHDMLSGMAALTPIAAGFLR